MAAYLLTWNPYKDYPWDEIEENIEEIKEFGACTFDWSSGATKSIEPGDRIFMLRLGAAQGVPHLGIVASGWAFDYCYQGDHWNEAKAAKGIMANFVPVAFDVILNPHTQHILLQDTLQYKFPQQHWSPQSSGISIKEEIVEALERLWDDTIRNQGLTQHPSYEEAIPYIDAYLEVLSEATDTNPGSNPIEEPTPPSTPAPFQQPINPLPIISPGSLSDPYLEVSSADIAAAAAEEESYQEGKATAVLVNRYERDPKARAEALRLHGTTCQACGFSFEQFYGLHGKDFIQVHHLKPVSSYGGAVNINPATDLAVLCSNCHSMVHRKPQSPLTIDQLKALLKPKLT